LKYYTFEINGQPVNLFEHDKNGNLIPMPQATINMEAVVSEIVKQLSAITSFQGSFNFHVRDRRTIHAPDISFTLKNVSDTIKDSDTNKKKKVFDDLNKKFKFEYFAIGTLVQIGFLINLKNEKMWIYKRNKKEKVFHHEHVWEDIDRRDILP
ncbi:22617_t:CDS:2, partial [Gigaspora margarita]